jgi:hypothetical protein
VARQRQRSLEVSRRAQVEHDAALVAVDRLEIGRHAVLVKRRAPAARLVAASGTLDLGHRRAEVGHHHRRERAGEDAREVEDRKLAERAL